MSDWFAVGSGVRQGYRIAPDLFLGPMGHMMERTVHRGMTGVTLGKEVFIDLDFADNVSLLAEMLEVLVLALIVMREEASTFDIGRKPKSYTFPPPLLSQRSRWQMQGRCSHRSWGGGGHDPPLFDAKGDGGTQFGNNSLNPSFLPSERLAIRGP